MNCSQIQRYCTEHAGEELSAACLEHLVACQHCRAAYERALTLCKLISLKRHETPDPGFDHRCLAAIERGLDAYEEQPRAWGQRIWGLFDLVPAPALRYAMAAAIVALIALQVITVQKIHSIESPVNGMVETTIIVEQPLLAADTNPSAPAVAELRPAGIILVASNFQPNGMQYGPGPSRLVGFEY
jgi:hypothetical protein